MRAEEEREMTYAEAVRRLEEIVHRLEDDTIPLEESLVCFQEGIRLSRYCREKLVEIEFQVEHLLKEEQAEPGELFAPGAPPVNGEDAGGDSA